MNTESMTMNTLKNADGTLLSPPTCYAFVVVRNTDDFHRVRQWCMDNMKGDPMIRVPHKFPIGISAYDERAGWTDSMDRAAKYVEVDYFFEHNVQNPSAPL
jgi:hypothetical protein